jgi:beta-mannosidase
MTEWFLMPKDFEATLWLSQIQQGMAMKFATEHFRRNMPRSMGALYWQLNDCWPVASWSSIDSFGRRKALHYMARHFFAPCLVSGVENLDAGEVAVFVSNDRREALKGNVDYLVTTAGGKKLASGTLAVRVAAGTSQRVGAVQVSKFLEGRSARDVLVWLDLKRGSTTLSKNLVMFSRPKHLLLEEPQIAAQVSEKAGVYIIKVRSKKTALWCWLDLKDADVELEDNFFHLRPGQVVTLRARHKKRLAAEAFAKKLVIRHLGTTHC